LQTTLNDALTVLLPFPALCVMLTM
jgi:hypothetical protein